MEYLPYQLVFSPDFFQQPYVLGGPSEKRRRSLSTNRASFFSSRWKLPERCTTVVFNLGVDGEEVFPPVCWRRTIVWLKGVWRLITILALASLSTNLIRSSTFSWFTCSYAWHWGKNNVKHVKNGMDSSTPEQSFWDINSKWEVGSGEFFA